MGEKNIPLNQILNLEDFEIISNVNPRKNPGGRPALIVNKIEYQIENITNLLIQIPWVVEAVWAILTPKNASNDSGIKRDCLLCFLLQARIKNPPFGSFF